MMTVNINSKKLNEQLAYLHDAMIGSGRTGDMATLIKDETRLLIQQAIKLTLPVASARSNGSAANDSTNKKQGLTAVARDIGRAMFVPKETAWKSKSIKKMIRDEDGDAFANFISRVPKMKAWKVEAFSKDLHQSKRDSRGRIQHQKKVFVMQHNAVMKYIKETQKHVGHLRSAWLGSAARAGIQGVKATAWVRKNSNSGNIGINRLTGSTPSVVIGVTSKGIGASTAAFKRALARREWAIRAKIRLILSGYAKDIAAGIRPQRRSGGLNASS
jgi:hypothetical protein